MYRAPLKDLGFLLDELLEAQQLAALPRYREYSGELAAPVLQEAARFAEQVLDPINALGDRLGAQLAADRVQMPAEFADAYHRFVDGGWLQLTQPVERGGQGMPLVLGCAVEEIGFGANLSFMLCPLLSRSAAEALDVAASPQLKAWLLPKLESGEWTGTMNLTEPQAGSDLGALRMRAVPEGDHYRLYGQKIFITYGEHDLAPNIVHLVLARIEGAPEGVRGISMFAVPKFLPGGDGALGARNDVRCVSLEHKLGIHASPTCVMAYGDREGAVGYLVGEAQQGLPYMFVMMNAARLSVAVQGVALAERARQQALEWARTRVQGHAIGAAGGAAVPIIEHPDVRRMLLTLSANVEAMRALCLYAAIELDRAQGETDEARRAAARTHGELLIPIVKGWCTEQAIELASIALQVHGGMGFIEETGAAQTLRDARITSIYEGTTGIQANDLLGRKLTRDRAAGMHGLIREQLRVLNEIRDDEPVTRAARNAATEALTMLRDATEVLMYQLAQSPAQAYAVSVPYLHLAGRVLGGVLMARSAARCTAQLQAGAADTEFYRGKLQCARFYAEHLLAQSLALLRIVKSGGASVVEADPKLL